MHANWVKETLASGGTGNLTTAGAVGGFVSLSTAFGLNNPFWYTVEDGTNREIGTGYLTTSNTLVRQKVHETLVDGELTRSAPAPINASAGAVVTVAATMQGLISGHTGGVFEAAGFAGMCSMGQVDEAGSAQQIAQNYIHAFPFWWVKGGMVSQASVWCTAAAAGSSLRVGLYENSAAGKPGRLLKEFTSGGALNTATTGAKTAIPSTPLWLPSGFYFAVMLTGGGSPSIKSPQYSPAGLWLGVNASGGRSVSLTRSFNFAALPADETAQAYTGQDYRGSVWLK